ncbi:MAG: GAF domain-containing protein [Anaerolineae bacterium]|nr:GAF domain-containing protein [Anaerolineae bacterium]
MAERQTSGAMSPVLQASQDALASLPPKAALQEILNSVVSLIPGVKSAFYLYLQGTKLRVLTLSDVPNDDPRFTDIMGFPLSKLQLSLAHSPHLQSAIESGQPLLILPHQLADITSGLIVQEVAGALRDAWQYQSLLFQPLVRPHRTLGFLVLLLEGEDGLPALNGTIHSLSGMAAAALDVLSLNQELERRQRLMDALNAVSLRVSRTLDLEQVMQQTVVEVAHVLEVEAAAISIIEPRTGELVIRAQQGLHAFAHTPVRIPHHKGVAWQTIQTKQHMIIDSWEDEPRLATPEFREEQVSTTVLVPMLTGGEPVGVLSAMCRIPREFLPEEIQLLDGIADHVAVAVKNASLHEQTQRRSQERAFLFDLAAAIAPLQSIDDIAREVLARTLTFLGWPIGVFLLEDSLSSALVPQARVGDSNTLQILINRMREVPYRHNVPAVAVISHSDAPPRTVAQIPIQARSGMLGWLILGTPDAVDVPLETQEILTTESNHLGIAVENVQLYQEMTEREKSSRALYQITRAMTGHDLHEMLRHTLEELHDGIAYDIAGVVITEPQPLEILRLRVTIQPERLEDIQNHLRASLGTLGSGLVAPEVNQVVIRGREAGALESNTLLSYLEAPIIQDNEPVGAILLARRSPFRVPDQRLLFILAYQLSKVLVTIRLFHQAQDQAHQLEETHALLHGHESDRADLFNDVAQELRTPLTYVQSYAELLLEGSLGRLSDAQYEALRVLNYQARRLSHLVRELGTMKAITPQNLQYQQVNLEKLLNHVAEELREHAQEKGLGLDVRVEPGLPDVRVDAERIRQVVEILAENALKFTPPGETVTLAASMHGESQVRVAVTDAGPGIAPEELAHIFKRLHQGKLGRKHPGIGIGLALSQWIVSAHGGAIGVEGKEGKGNTFYFQLPV